MERNERGCFGKFVKFLEKLRQDGGYKKSPWAKKLGIYPQTYQKIATGSDMRLSTLVQIKDKLNLDWGELGKLIDAEFKKS